MLTHHSWTMSSRASEATKVQFSDAVYARCKTLKKSSCLTRAITTFSH